MRIIAVLPILASVALACSGGSPSACGGAAVRPDRPAPVLFGSNVADGTDLRFVPGRPTLINVWGSWCAPCRQEQPVFSRLAREHPEIDFFGIDVQDNDAAARAFQKEFAVGYPSLADPSFEKASRLGARAAPATFAVDREGIVRAARHGTVDLDIANCMIDLAT